jgi:hypothetical protein
MSDIAEAEKKLKPCPFCAAKRMKIVCIGGDWQIECRCGAGLKFADMVGGIIEAWNRRPQLVETMNHKQSGGRE